MYDIANIKSYTYTCMWKKIKRIELNKLCIRTTLIYNVIIITIIKYNPDELIGLMNSCTQYKQNQLSTYNNIHILQNNYICLSQ